MEFILFILPLLTVAAVNAECPWDEPGLLPWSGGAATWGSAAAVPSAGDDVVIPANKRILLDVSPPALRSLTIEAGAALTWGDVDDVTLKSSYILVNGKFEIGSSSCRFQKKATIILAGKTKCTANVPGPLAPGAPVSIFIPVNRCHRSPCVFPCPGGGGGRA